MPATRALDVVGPEPYPLEVASCHPRIRESPSVKAPTAEELTRAIEAFRKTAEVLRRALEQFRNAIERAIVSIRDAIVRIAGGQVIIDDEVVAIVSDWIIDEDETVVIGDSDFPMVDSAPHDGRPTFCWRCNATPVPDDPKHCGACDSCVDDLRNGDGPKDGLVVDQVIDYDGMRVALTRTIESALRSYSGESLCVPCGHGEASHTGGDRCYVNGCSCTQLQLVTVGPEGLTTMRRQQ